MTADSSSSATTWQGGTVGSLPWAAGPSELAALGPSCPTQAQPERALPQVSHCCPSGVSVAAEDGDLAGDLCGTHQTLSRPARLRLRLQQGRWTACGSPYAGLTCYRGCCLCLGILPPWQLPGEAGGHKL